jgi:hypothetical protein
VPDPGYRDLAERLISRHFGPFRGSVLLGELPADPRLDIPAPPGARLVGSITRRRGDAPLAVSVVFDAPGEADELFGFYGRELAARGWKASAPPMSEMRGFHSAMTPQHHGVFVKGTEGPFLMVSVTGAGRPVKDVLLEWNSGEEGHPARFPDRHPDAMERIPPLTGPEGVEIHPGGGGGGPDSWRTDGEALTDMPAPELEREFASQLEAAGWNRTAGGSDGPVAWSQWRLPEDDWSGVLLVIESPRPSRRTLWLSIESARERHGFWSSIALGRVADGDVSP